MRKSFLYALAAVALLSSCSQDDSAPAGDKGDKMEIKIGVTQENEIETRGTGTVGSTDDALNNWDGQEVYVCMFEKGTLKYAKEDVTNNVLFDHKTALVTPTGANSGTALRTDKAVKYYPTQKEFDFWGFHLDDAYDGSDPTTVDNGDGTESLVVDFAIDGTQDIMAAKAVPNVDEVNTYLAGDDSRVFSAFAARKGLASGNPGTLQPTLKFRHLLTRLSFEVKGGEAAVCEGGTKEIFVDTIKVKSLTTGDFVMAYTGAERSQISFDAGSEQFLTLKQRPSASQNEDLIDLVPVTPGVDGSGEPAFTSVGEALLVAPADENGYEISVILRQNVEVDTDGNKEDKTYEYKAYITNKKNDKPENQNKPFEAGKSYNVKITIWGLSEITITTALEKWEDGGNIDLPIEDEQF